MYKKRTFKILSIKNEWIKNGRIKNENIPIIPDSGEVLKN